MKQLSLALLLAFFLVQATSCQQGDQKTSPPGKKILVYGNGMEKEWLQEVVGLTGKKDPVVLFLPTASADNPRVIDYILKLCEGLPLEPRIMITFVASSPGQESFAEQILGADAIVVGGGNTLNMLGIWKAQGIDTLLWQAYDRGIILAGGSAGSLCWFTGGWSDTRPGALSLVDCLGFLPYSHCPHYNDGSGRKEL